MTDPLDLDALEKLAQDRLLTEQRVARGYRLTTVEIEATDVLRLIERLRDKQKSVEAAFRFFIDICETLGVKPDDTEPDEVPMLIEGLVEQLVKRAEAAEAHVTEAHANCVYWTTRALEAEAKVANHAGHLCSCELIVFEESQP